MTGQPAACSSVTRVDIYPLRYDKIKTAGFGPISTEESLDVTQPSPDDSLDELIRLSQEGNMRAMEMIYERFKRPLFNLAYRYTYDRALAEDLLHDIFIKIYNNIHSLDREKAFVGWIYRVAINTCLSHLRRKKSEVQKAISLTDMDDVTGDVEDKSREKILSKPLEEAIRALPSKLKSVFLLHDLQGYKHREIAEILGWSVGTSKSQLFKARMKMRAFLKGKDLL
ncbi:MAG: RNA polymerase sigma factor [Acidobacteria bacterium]|nr:RNA polymerase sigma factor [Acidobacteriota bacterium]MBU4254602.1 RNA polymerase sigma factor [Acidobacteriota bacterium]MBU4331460.1 RNA polymerase sigma factor [Acidobacteriota bacterium]MCG2814765.1 RNA polymerase sigma factor [Candidatus Aminicenantes bacterium]